MCLCVLANSAKGGTDGGGGGDHEEMTDAEKEKRRRAQTDKAKKLQNPLYFVSANRLVVRNLKKTVTNEELRNLCRKATHAGLACDNLVGAQDIANQLTAQGQIIRPDQNEERLAIPAFTDIGGSDNGKKMICSAKIMLDKLKIR